MFIINTQFINLVKIIILKSDIISIMELNYMNNLPLGGFNYDNCLRNKAIEANLPADKKLKFTKTGTTICGCVFNVSR